MTDKQAQFLPFHAINEFMLDDFRLEVIRQVLHALPELPTELRGPLDRLTHRVVKVPGFRSAEKAPPGLLLKPMAQAFEKNPQLVAAVLQAWAASRPGLRKQVFELLTGRGWELLPDETDRRKLPGFIAHWPAGEDFDRLYDAYLAAYPADPAEKNPVSLMIVWLSLRLPYQVDEDAPPA